jgi:hypothetical protein
LYTNFLSRVLQVTALLVDALAISILATRVFGREFKRSSRRSVALGTLIGVLIVGINVAAFVRPPTPAAEVLYEACVYDVAAGESIPIRPGGKMIGTFKTRAAESLNSASVIIGIDASMANPDATHPIDLHLRTEDGDILTYERKDIVNNDFSRFELDPPLEADAGEVIQLTIINRSDDPIGIYVKQPGPGDQADGVGDGVVAVGKIDAEAGFTMRGFALSGCVTRLP